MGVVVVGGGNSSNNPIAVGKVKSVVAYNYGAFAITTDGKLYGWGDNFYNVLGLGETPVYKSNWTGTYRDNYLSTVVETPYHLSSVGKVKSLEISGATVYAITEEGKLYAWGDNEYGEVGNGSSGLYAEQTTPYELTSIVGKVKSVISGSTVYAITEEGKLYAWGSNTYGQVGNGSTGTQTIPYELTSIVGKVKSIETDGSTVYAITEDGKLYAWGLNEYGEVGNGESGSNTKQLTPYEVTDIVGKVKSVIDGYAITEEGKLYAWGYGYTSTPQEVTGIVGKVKSVISGYGDYAITEEGKLYAWGTGYTSTPQEVTGIVGKVKSLEVYDGDYGDIFYAITEEGKLYAWGDNRNGEVGNGSTGAQTTPYEVTSVGKVKSLEVYYGYDGSTVYAITEDGRLYAWGFNEWGEVGNGRSGYGEDQTTPYEVTSIIGKVKSVVTSGSTVYAITEEGKLYAWGDNRYGEVGNGSRIFRSVTTPTLVLIPAN